MKTYQVETKEHITLALIVSYRFDIYKENNAGNARYVLLFTKVI